jgi:hypothetical protein
VNSWTDWRRFSCTCRTNKVWLQCDYLWSSNNCLRINVSPHFSNGHVYFIECCLLCSIKRNDLPQVEQRYGTECFLDLCSRYSASVLNTLEQILQICSALCIFICCLKGWPGFVTFVTNSTTKKFCVYHLLPVSTPWRKHQVAQLHFVARTFSWNIETEN